MLTLLCPSTKILSGAVLGTGDTGDCPLATSFSYQPSNTNISCTIANTEIVFVSDTNYNCYSGKMRSSHN